MSPRRSVDEAQRTRARIIDKALAIAGAEGFDGVTIGRLAADLDMSKAGAIGPFGSKEALQLAVFHAAVARFRAQVPAKITGMPSGLDRLLRLFDAWADYLAGDTTPPGGCLLAAAAAEYDTRRGRVHDAVLDASRQWLTFLAAEVQAAIDVGDLPSGCEAEQLAFALNGIALAVNQSFQLHEDRSAAARGRRAARTLLAHAQASVSDRTPRHADGRPDASTVP